MGSPQSLTIDKHWRFLYRFPYIAALVVRVYTGDRH